MKISTLILSLYFAFFLIGIAFAVDSKYDQGDVRNEGVVVTLMSSWKDMVSQTTDEMHPYVQVQGQVLPRPSSSPSSRQERADHRCGLALGNSPCGPGRCCSVNGWCGDSYEYCRGSNCRYQCWDSSTTECPSCLTRARLRSISYYGVSQIISETLFNSMFKHRKDCPSQGFYSYDAFVTAAVSFPGFGTTGDRVTRKRELAAFFGQTSQATTGQWSYSVGAHAWGYCHINKTTGSTDRGYCTSPYWPCAPGKKYNGRGPVQLTHNYNYGLAGEALGLDLINNPDLVATDPVVSFKTAIWFWMTQHDYKPSCHSILVNANSEGSDHDHHYAPIGYGVIGDIINGGSSFGTNTITTSTGYYKRYCDMLGVSYGKNLKYWYDRAQRPFYGVAETKTSSPVGKKEETKWQLSEVKKW